MARPRLDPNSETVQFPIVVPTTLKEAVIQRAREQKITTSAAIREALRQYLQTSQDAA